MNRISSETDVTRPWTPPWTGSLPPGWRQLLRSMLCIRYFEDQVKALFGSGLVRGSTHLCQGQEAVAVGVCSLLTPGDVMTCTYRGHGAVLAAGAAMDACFAEILGREGGLCGGKGGSMHLADFDEGHHRVERDRRRPASDQPRGGARRAIPQDGEGERGVHRRRLDQHRGFSRELEPGGRLAIARSRGHREQPLRRVQPPCAPRLQSRACRDRAARYGIPGVLVDGNDLLAVRQVAEEAIARARAGEGPTLIEADTYRHEGHSRSDPAKYRPAGELELWLGRDPIPRFEEVVLSSGRGDTRRAGARSGRRRRGSQRRPSNGPRTGRNRSLDRLYEDVYQ